MDGKDDRSYERCPKRHFDHAGAEDGDQGGGQDVQDDVGEMKAPG